MSKVGWILSTLLIIAGISQAAETVQKPARVTTTVVQTGAIVEAVNKETRELKLIGPDNRRFTVVADERVRNFDQIKPRDRITVEYLESVAIVVSPASSQGTVDEAELTAVTVAAPGDMPGVGVIEAKGVTAIVSAIDRVHRIATLTLPDGEIRTVRVQDDVALDLVNVGDRVTTVITQAIAVTVRPPPQ